MMPMPPPNLIVPHNISLVHQENYSKYIIIKFKSLIQKVCMTE